MNGVLAILPAVTLMGVGLICIIAARLVKTSPVVMFIAAGVLIGANARRGAALLQVAGVEPGAITDWMAKLAGIRPEQCAGGLKAA